MHVMLLSMCRVFAWTIVALTLFSSLGNGIKDIVVETIVAVLVSLGIYVTKIM